ncbi:MAG: MATE family efflux transporter [Desulfobacteraceae bacterium]|nr:MATE family efflux transporter [Desulfobacteraceae bacterium]
MNPIQQRWHAKGGYRDVLHIAFPLVLSSSAWTIQTFVDRIFLSWYSPEAIAASGPAGFLNITIVHLFTGTTGYVSVFIAQYFGSHRLKEIGPVLWQSLYFAFGGALFILCLIPWVSPFFNLVGHPLLVRQNEITYFSILCTGGLPVLVSAAFSGFFSGLGRTWAIMWINLFSTLVNLVLDYALIFGRWGFPEMGIAGAAIASVFAATLSCLAFIPLVFTKKNNQTYGVWSGKPWEKDLFLRLLRFGFPSGVQVFVDILAFTVFVFLVGRLGTESLAATNIAFNINMLAFVPMFGTGMAVSILVGRHLGEDKPDLAKFSVYSGFHLTCVYMITLALAYVLVPDLFILPFAANSNPEEFGKIHAITTGLLRFVAIYSLFDAMNIIFSSAIKGAGDTRFVMFMLLVLSSLGLVMPTYFAMERFNAGLTACWIIATAYVILLGSSFYLRFLGGKWQKMRVIEKEL